MVLPLGSEEFCPPVGRRGRRVWCSITSGIAEQILEKVDPEFLNAAKITQNLTPGRNHGFFNMMVCWFRCNFMGTSRTKPPLFVQVNVSIIHKY
jgi:hypothetical protein